jgi:hypothetical protein
VSEAFDGTGILLEWLADDSGLPPDTWVPVGELLSLKPPALSRNEYVDTRMKEKAEHMSLGATLRIGQITGTINLILGAGTDPVRGWRIEPGVNDALDFDLGAGPQVAIAAPGFYVLGPALADAVAAAMVAAAPSIEWLAFHGVTGPLRFRIFNETPQGGGGFTPFNLLTSTGPNAATAIWDEIGFSRASDHTGSDTYSSDFDVEGSAVLVTASTAKKLLDDLLDDGPASQTLRIRHDASGLDWRFEGRIQLFDPQEVTTDAAMQATFAITIRRRIAP